MAIQADLSERDHRFKAVREAMERDGIAALVVAGHASQFNRGYVRYLADVHLWAGDSLILIPLEGEPVHVQVTYASASMPDELWIPDYRRSPAPQTEIISAIQEQNLTTSTIGIAGLERVITVGAYEALQQAFPGVRFVDADHLMNQIRAIKSPLEIQQFREVWKLAQAAMDRFVDVIEPGLSQREAAAEAGRVIRAGGSFDDLTLIQDGAFRGLPRDVPLRCDDLVGLHLEVCGESGHWAELNVTCAFKEPTALEQKLMESELRAYREVLRAARPGVTLADLENVFLEVVKLDGWELGEPAWHYSYHGVGMDAIEWPYFSPMIAGNRDTELKEGMVFSYHPHRATIPHVDRIPAIYDDFVITTEGAEQLSINWDLRWRIMV